MQQANIQELYRDIDPLVLNRFFQYRRQQKAIVSSDGTTNSYVHKPVHSLNKNRKKIRERNGQSGKEQQNKLSVHFTLLSTDYHLERMQLTHCLSKTRSIFSLFEAIDATWNLLPVDYPYSRSKYQYINWLGEIYRLQDLLVGPLVNLEGVVQRKEFFQQESYRIILEIFMHLTAARLRIYEYDAKTRLGSLNDFYHENGSFKKEQMTDDKSFHETHLHDKNVLFQLEDCSQQLRSIYLRLTPAAKFSRNILPHEFRKTMSMLKNVINQLNRFTDPDRTLNLQEYQYLLDECDLILQNEE